MKKLYGLLAIIALCFASCTRPKPAPVPDSGCVSRTWVAQNSYSISPADYNTALALFQQNNIDYSQFRWYSFGISTIVNGNVTNTYQSVRGDQYINGLRVFNADVIYDFKNGQFYMLNGDTLSASSALDTLPALSLLTVRKIFTNKLLATNSPQMQQYLADCMTAEFGYFDLNEGASGTPQNLVKAWRIFPQSNRNLSACINDNGSLIAFSTGIVTF